MKKGLIYSKRYPLEPFLEELDTEEEVWPDGEMEDTLDRMYASIKEIWECYQQESSFVLKEDRVQPANAFVDQVISFCECYSIDVDIRTSGVVGAPWRVELAFFGIDRISNEHMTMSVRGDEVLVLKDSYFTVSNGESSMEVGPAFGVHHFTDGKEDSEVKTPGAATVYLTDYTEFHHTISIKP